MWNISRTLRSAVGKYSHELLGLSAAFRNQTECTLSYKDEVLVRQIEFSIKVILPPNCEWDGSEN